jgi:hypothetical protein
LDEGRIDSTRKAIEQVVIAGSKVILTGSLMIGLLLPEYEGFLHSPESVSVAVVVHREQDRSGSAVVAPIHARNGTMAAVPPQEDDGHHDHREGQPIVVKLTSPTIVTGAGLPDQPDRWLNRI